MKLTTEQLAALNSKGNSLIVACPGSGKTRTLMAKMLQCVDEVRGTPHKIATLTYTNAAVHEIEFRLWREGSEGDSNYCHIATIHSFCLSNIIQQFHELIPGYENGYVVIPPSSEVYKEIAATTLEAFGLDRNMQASFENLNRKPDGQPTSIPDIPDAVILAFWECLQDEGFIDFPNIIYRSFHLLAQHESISRALASKYKWMLVDEFQDTTALQVEIFRYIEQHKRTKFFLVGDPHQSIYGFAGAVPELLFQFANDIGAVRATELLGNFRSSSNIVGHGEKLCPRDPPMTAVGDVSDFGVEPQHMQVASYTDAIIDTFIPALKEHNIDFGEAAIFSPWWFDLYHLSKALRDHGIPVVGPGSRPYRRLHHFASMAEQICAYITEKEPRQFHQLQKEIFLVLDRLEGEQPIRIYSFESRLLAQKLIRACEETASTNRDVITWLILASDQCATILKSEGLITENSANMLRESAQHMIEDMESNDVDPSKMQLEDLGIFSDVGKSMKLMTLHRAKGREFDGVAIIDVHDGRLPNYRAIKANDLEKIEEGRRVFYVGITRARKYLLYVTKESTWKTQPSRFLQKDGLGIL